MNIEEMNLQEVEERLSAIEVEVRSMENPDEVNRATEEKIQLLERKAVLKDLEERKNAAAALEAGKAVPTTTIKEEREKITMEDFRSSKEYRSAWLKNIQGKEMNEEEKRAFTTATDSAGAVIPVATADIIIEKVKKMAPLLDEIQLFNVAGNLKVAVEGSIAEAQLHTQGSSISADDDALVEIALGTYEITKLVTVSKSVMNQATDAFEAWLTDMLAERIADKCSKYIIEGTGSGQPSGLAAVTWTTTNSITVASTGTLTTANVMAAEALFDNKYEPQGKYLMSRKTLFNDFMPLQDKGKNDVVRMDGGKYYVYGREVLEDSRVKFHDAYLGAFKHGIVGNLSNEIGVSAQWMNSKNGYDVLGAAGFDCKVADETAFVKITKATA